jgi:hypothetical protein
VEEDGDLDDKSNTTLSIYNTTLSIYNTITLQHYKYTHSTLGLEVVW